MQVIKWALFVALSFISTTTMAEVLSAKGKATVAYTERKASSAVKDKALFNAQMKAIETYYAEAGDAQAENLDAIRDQIKAEPDRFILETTVLQEDDNKDDRKYTVAIRVSLNGSNLRNALKKTSVAGSSKAATGEHSQLTFLFVSRQVDTQTTYDPRVTQRAIVSQKGSAESSLEDNGSQSESVKKGRVKTADSRKTKSNYASEDALTIETGGSTVTRSATSTWRVLPSQNLSQIFTQNFKTAGYRVVEAQYLEPLSQGKLKISSVENDYKSGNDLSSTTMQNVVAGLKNAQVRYVAMGTLDVGQVGFDDVTGLQRVSVTVNAKVMDVGSAIPESVAVAGPVQFSGVGPTEDEARTEALKLAAQNTARELTSQLNNAGIR
jgi:hypothetical protein